MKVIYHRCSGKSCYITGAVTFGMLTIHTKQEPICRFLFPLIGNETERILGLKRNGLDQPVSNSGRLKSLIYEICQNYHVSVEVAILCEVDRILEKSSGVITSDAIILDHCISWFNLNSWIVDQYIKQVWIFKLMDSQWK